MNPPKPALNPLALLVSSALLLAVACLAGCATANGGGQRLVRIAAAAANIAATKHLLAHPGDIPKFVAAELLLSDLRGNTNATPAQLAMALEKLPMLRGDTGAIYVSALTPIIWDELAQAATRIDRMEGLQNLIAQLDAALVQAIQYASRESRPLLRLP